MSQTWRIVICVAVTAIFVYGIIFIGMKSDEDAQERQQKIESGEITTTTTEPPTTTTTIDPEAPTTEYNVIDMGKWNRTVHTKCDHGNRLYQAETYYSDQSAVVAVVPNDPTCAEVPQ